MKLLPILLSFLAFSVIGLLFLHFSHLNITYLNSSDAIEDNNKLHQVIRIQNETIHTLEKLLRDTTSSASSQVTVGTQSVISNAKVENPRSCAVHEVPLSTMESDCEKRYGMELVDIWEANKQTWCQGQDSYLECYPYHQAHKKLDGRQSDLFCQATNFIIDFSKVHGEYSKTSKPGLGNQYLNFDKGSLQSSCSKTPQYRSQLFMPHHSLQMGSFQADYKAMKYDQIEDSPTYLLARDEDCENSFHSTADFMNMFLVKNALDIDLSTLQVMLFDKFPDGPYYDLIKQAYSPMKPILRHEHYQGKRVMFKKLIFHLESPAGLIFPKVSRPDPLRCYDTSLFDAYRRFVLQSFNLLDVKPPEIPTVTLSLRHRTQQKNVGRIMSNEEDVIKILKKGNMMNLNIVDTSKMSFTEQLKLVRSTNVLVGIHGAGLMFIMYAAEEAVLVEIHPSYRQDRHFRHASRMTGKIYMPMRTTIRETCSGTSDSVTVPLEEFERTIDGAIRIARNFDDGISECGLVCNGGILALDNRLDPHYKNGERKTQPINTNFPCN